MGILSNLFKPKSGGTKFEPRKARYQTSASPAEPAPPLDEAADKTDIATPQATLPGEQPLKSISFGESKKSPVSIPPPAGPAQQKKNIASTPAAGVTKSTRKVLTTRENSIPDKQVIIDLADILSQIPGQFLKADKKAGAKKEIRFKAYDLLQGLALGKASVSLARIAELSPELFTDQRPGGNVEILLPLQKVVSQIGAFPCRPDQMEVQFPPLDSQYASLIVEKAESAAAHAVPPGTLIIPAPVPEVQAISEPEKNKTDETGVVSKTPREMDPGLIEQILLDPVPATESAGPPLADEEEEEEKIEALPEPPVIDDEVTYSLAALWPNVPKSWLVGDAKPDGYSARVTVPFRLVEAQLASGRVELSFADFFEALPEEFKKHFSGDSEESKAARIQIPLNEVFQNLPGVEPLPPSPKPAAREAGEEKLVQTEENTGTFSEIEEPELDPGSEPCVDAVEKQEPATAEIPNPVAEEETKTPVESAVTGPAVVEPQEKKAETPEPPPAAPQSEPPVTDTPHTPAPEITAKPEEHTVPVEPQAPVGAPMTESVETATPIYNEPSESSQIAATLTPPKVQLQRVVPPAVFAQEISAAPPEASIPEPEPGKILAFEGTSLTFNPNAVEDLFMTDGKLDSRKTVEHISRFPGTQGVVLTHENETNSAGEIPQHFNAANTATAASTLFQSLESPSDQDGKAPTRDVTLRHDGFSSTWFKQRHILLGILHSDRSLEEALHNKLVLVTEELADLR